MDVCANCVGYLTNCHHVCPVCHNDVELDACDEVAREDGGTRYIEGSTKGARCESCGNWTHEGCLAYGNGYNGEMCNGCAQADFESRAEDAADAKAEV